MKQASNYNTNCHYSTTVSPSKRNTHNLSNSNVFQALPSGSNAKCPLLPRSPGPTNITFTFNGNQLICATLRMTSQRLFTSCLPLLPLTQQE